LDEAILLMKEYLEKEKSQAIGAGWEKKKTVT